MRVLVLYAGDLVARSVVSPGGINTNLRGYLGGLPAEWEVEVWGAWDRRDPAPLAMKEHQLANRAVRLRPLVTAGPTDDRKVPLAFRYCAALGAAAARGAVSRARWDVVFSHRTEYLATLALTTRATSTPPALSFIHGSSSWSIEHMGGIKGRAQILGERLSMARASRVALVSRSTLPYYQRLYPARADRFVWVPNGVDVDRLGRGDRAAWRAEHGFGEDARVLLYLGRYEVEKGIARMLDAFRLLRAAEPGVPWHLVCAGGGPLETLIRDAAATWGAGHVHDIGQVSQSAVPSVLAGADVSLLFSDFEGLSNSMLESLAAGTPMVATDVGDNAVVLEHVAPELVVRGFEPAAIAERIAWAWSARLALRPRVQAAARTFSLQRRIDRIVELAESIAAVPSPMCA